MVLRRVLSSIAVAVVGSVLGISVAAQTNLNEQFLEAARAGNWELALETIDQIVETNPARRDDLEPYRVRFVRRLEIDQAVEAANWSQAVTLIESFSETYPGDAAILAPLLDQTRTFAEIEQATQTQNWRQALSLIDGLIALETPPRPDFVIYRTQILEAMPQIGQVVDADSWKLAATRVSTVTDSSQSPPSDSNSRQILVNLNVRNDADRSRALELNDFALLDGAGNSYSAIDGSQVVSADLDSVATSVDAGTAIATAIAFNLPVASNELKLIFNPNENDIPTLVNLKQ